MSLVKQLIKSASHSVLAGMTSAVGAFAAAAIVARTLGVHGTASVAIALWISFAATTLSDVGVTGSLARFMGRKSGSDHPGGLRSFVWDRFKALSLAIAGGLVLTGVILAFYWPDILAKYSNSRHEAYLICALIALFFVVHMLFAFCYQYLRGSLEFRAISRFSMIGSVLQVAGVFVGSRYFGVAGALAGYLLANLPMLWVLSRVRAERAPPPHERVEVRGYAKSFYVAALFSPLLWTRADLLLVDQIANPRAVGLFAAAAAVSALLIQVCQMVCNALLPNILRGAAEQPASFPQVSGTSTRFGMFVLLPVCFIGAALAPNAIALVYGAPFLDAGPTAVLLGCAAAASAITLVLSGVLNAASANVALVRSGAVGAVLTVVLGIAFVFQFGLVGAAMGRLGAQSAAAALTIAAANRVVPGLVRVGWFSRYLLSSALAGAVAWMAAQGGGAAGLLLGGLAGGLVFVIVTLLSLRLVPEDQQPLRRLIEGQSSSVRRAATWILGSSVS